MRLHIWMRARHGDRVFKRLTLSPSEDMETSHGISEMSVLWQRTSIVCGDHSLYGSLVRTCVRVVRKINLRRQVIRMSVTRVVHYYPRTRSTSFARAGHTQTSAVQAPLRRGWASDCVSSTVGGRTIGRNSHWLPRGITGWCVRRIAVAGVAVGVGVDWVMLKVCRFSPDVVAG
jgi:hypothetical protein